jgi:phage-related baseplate assembly protein
MMGGMLPTESELDGIAAILTDTKIRPLTDFVKVLAPTQINYEIDLSYYIRSSDSVSAAYIQENVAKTIQDYLIWQKAEIKRDINPSELIARIIQAGAKRVNLISPVFKTLSNSEVAKDTKVNVVYGGLEAGN